MKRRHNVTNEPEAKRNLPVKIILAVVVSILPITAWPWYMAKHNFHFDDRAGFLAIVFPIYIILCGYLAFKCYAVKREITYILLLIMWLSYGAALFL